MSGIMKPLQLLRNVRRDMISGRLEDGDYNPGLYRTIGSVTYYILPRRKNPRLNTFVLKKAVSTNIAERLADLGPVNTLFTFEVYANAAIIPSFTDAASLEDILVVRASWPFDPQHCRILVADILAGLSSLHNVGLQRNSFDVRDILLVCRDNTHFFQIAGIEYCTCIHGHEPTNSEELQSLVATLKYVYERIESSRIVWIEDFVRLLGACETLDSTSLKKAARHVPEDIDQRRRELEIYLHAVRIFGTTLGGNSTEKGGAE
ncbi:hypothetical protein IQ07DRAFT_650816 [Pyrenochaeta sp. DS3sAY3a]|nr:hypothetical protein IQ07DRAFT_670475 [Pyrenochaeta sp. DS3sAY3a]OAL42664.1 hypothetical protein IQ07DRAFT_650816 [Pyrenochaeta sp. DS3sAY3a]